MVVSWLTACQAAYAARYMRNTSCVLAFLLISTSLSSCVGTSVGTSRVSNHGQEVQRSDECLGYCKQMDPDGRCVEFTAGMSPVCAEYMLAAGVFTDMPSATGQRISSAYAGQTSNNSAQRLASESSGSPNFDAQNKALQLIGEFAKSICNDIPLNASKQNIDLTGQAKIALNSLVGKVADVGISGAGRYINEESMGVLQKDLAHSLEVGGNCKYNVFIQLKDKLLPSASAPR